jgi:segregation and condensation protein A
MDGGSADRGHQRDAAGAGWTPPLALGAFVGTLDHLLTLARTQQIDLLQISLPALVEQLAAALLRAPATTPLGQKADWVVMAAWLVQLRTRLLLPADAPAQPDAAGEAGQLRGQLVALQETKALAGWLERRSQLGHDVFARGKPEIFGVSVETAQAIDVIAFLWASLALFDDGATEPDTATTHRPIHLDLYAVAEARVRILHRLATTPGGASLEQLLPEAPEPPGPPSRQTVRRRSASASTFLAALELAKQGDVLMGQLDAFTPIQVTLAAA